MATSIPRSNCPNIVIVPTVSLRGDQQACPTKQTCSSTAVTSSRPVNLKVETATGIYNKIASHPDPSLQPSVSYVYSAPVKSKTIEYHNHNPTLDYQSTPSVINPIMQTSVPYTKCTQPVPTVSSTVEQPSQYPATFYYHHTPPTVQTPSPYDTTCTTPLNAIPNNEMHPTTLYYVPMNNNNCLSQNFNYPTPNNWTPDFRQLVCHANNNIYWGYGNNQHWTYPDNYNQGIAIANKSSFVPNDFPHRDLINPIYNSIPEGIQYTQTHEPCVPIVKLTASQDHVEDYNKPIVPAVDLKEPSSLLVPEDLNPRRAEGSTNLGTYNTQNTIKTIDPSNKIKVSIGSPLQIITLAKGKTIPCNRLEDISAVDNKQIEYGIDKKSNNFNIVSENEKTITVDQFNKNTKTVDEVVVAVESINNSNEMIPDNITKMLQEFINKNKKVVASHDSSNNNNNKGLTRNIEKIVDEFIRKTKKAIEENEQRVKTWSAKKNTTTKQLTEILSKKEISVVPNKGVMKPQTKTQHGYKREKPKTQTRNIKLMPSSQIEKLKQQLASVENEINKRKRQLEIKEQLIKNEIDTIKLKSKIIGSDGDETVEKNTPETLKIQRTPVTDANDSNDKQYKDIVSTLKNKTTTIANKLEHVTSKVGKTAPQLKSVVTVPRKLAVLKENISLNHTFLYNKDDLKNILVTKNVSATSNVNGNTSTNLKIKYKNDTEENEHTIMKDLQIKLNNDDGYVDGNDISRKVTVQNKRKREPVEDKVSNIAKKIKRIEFIIKLVQEDSQSDIENDSDHYKTDHVNQSGVITADLSFLDDIDVDEIADCLNVPNRKEDKEEMNTRYKTCEAIDHQKVKKSFNVCETESISSISDFLYQTKPKDILKTSGEDTMVSPLNEVGHVHIQKECPEDYVHQQNYFRKEQSTPHAVVTSNIEAHVMVDEPQVDNYNLVPTVTKPCIEEAVPEKELGIEHDKAEETFETFGETVDEQIDLDVENYYEDEILDKFANDVKYASSETINILGDQETIFPDESTKDCFGDNVTTDPPKDYIIETDLIGTGVKTEVEDHFDVPVKTEIIDQKIFVVKFGNEVNTNNEIDNTPKENSVPSTKNETAVGTLTTKEKNSESVTKENYISRNEKIPYSNENYGFEAKAERVEKDAEFNISLLPVEEKINANLDQPSINADGTTTKAKSTKTYMEIPKQMQKHIQNNSKIDNSTESCNNLENNSELIQNPAPKVTIKCRDISKLQYAKVIMTQNPANSKSKAAKAEYEKHITILAKRLSQTITERTGLIHNISSIVHKGTFSTIYKCTDISGKLWVLKVLNIGTYEKNKAKHKMLTNMQNGVPKEKLFMVYLMKQLYFDKCCCYLMDYYPKNLEQALREASQPFHIDLIQELARQLVSAVVLLRNHKLMHSDIKPTHILMTANNNKLKLCGFDDAYQMATTTTSIVTAHTGTVQYRPPEVILGHTYSRGYNIDVWSTALVLHEMATRSRLIDGTTNNEVLYQQMCLFGPAPASMLEQCEFKDVYYSGDIFMRRGSEMTDPQVPKEQVHFKKSTRLSASINQAYFKHYSKIRSPDQKVADIISIRNFCKLLAEMLIIDPLKRMTIEFVYANPFIYK